MASSTKGFNLDNDSFQISGSSGSGNRSLHILNFDSSDYKESLKRKARAELKPGVKKRKSFVKKFRKEWMDEPIFRGWLAPIPNKSERCWCSVCNVVLLCGHSELEKHASGKKHSDLMLMKTFKGEFMDSGSIQVGNSVILQEDTSANASQDDPLEYGETYEITDGNELEPRIFLQVTSDGNLIQMPKEGYDLSSTNVNNNSKTSDANKITLPLRGSAVMKGNTTITRTMNSITKQTGKVSVIPQNMLQTKTPRNIVDAMTTDSEDEFYDDDEEEDDVLDSRQLLKEMKNEVLYQEKKMADEKRLKGDKDPGVSENKINGHDDIMTLIAEKELEVRLQHLEEKRRQDFNIYKLKLQGIEDEIARREEIHKLKIKHLETKIKKEQLLND